MPRDTGRTRSTYGRGTSAGEGSRFARDEGRRSGFGGDRRPLWPIVLIFSVLGLIVAGRLVFLQVIDSENLTSQAIERGTNVATIHARRGTIYDRSGKVLALSVDCKTVYCNPKEIEDAPDVAARLSDVLGGEPTDYLDALMQDASFSYLAQKVDRDKAEELVASLAEDEVKGIYLLDDTRREYPYGSVAGQVLGTVGTEGHGMFGLEYYYDEVLSGVDGQLIMEVGRDGTPVAGGASEIVAARDGSDIILSLDIEVQRMAEQTILQATKDYDADSGAVMACDPRTGEIIAACSTPLLDPGDQETYVPEAMTLSLVSEIYEPGSIFKVLTMAIGLEEGIISPESSFWVPSTIEVGDDVVADDDLRDYEMEMSCTEILRRSSNVGAVVVASRIGEDAFAAGVERFGIGKPSGIDYPGDIAGLVTPRNEYIGATLGAMSFGQAIAVPFDQIVRAVGAIANDGVMETPHFVTHVGGEEVAYESPGVACSKETADKVTQMMGNVVEAGTGMQAQVSGYRIAGKTGTGEQASENELGYVEEKYTSSFIGFANVDNPEILIYVGLNGTPYLAEASAAPVFSAIMNEAANDLGLSPVIESF